MSKTTNKCSPEVRSRAVRMILEHQGDYPSRWSAVVSIAEKIGCVPQTMQLLSAARWAFRRDRSYPNNRHNLVMATLTNDPPEITKLHIPPIDESKGRNRIYNDETGENNP